MGTVLVVILLPYQHHIMMQRQVRAIVEHYGSRGHCQMVVTILCVLYSGGWSGGTAGNLLYDKGDQSEEYFFHEDEDEEV